MAITLLIIAHENALPKFLYTLWLVKLPKPPSKLQTSKNPRTYIQGLFRFYEYLRTEDHQKMALLL